VAVRGELAEGVDDDQVRGGTASHCDGAPQRELCPVRRASIAPRLRPTFP
jgi:hypothetical protein